MINNNDFANIIPLHYLDVILEMTYVTETSLFSWIIVLSDSSLSENYPWIYFSTMKYNWHTIFDRR